MQPYKQKYKSWRYSQINQRLAEPMQPCLPKELAEIYYTPIPRVGVSQKSKDTDLMFITLVGVQHLYPRLDYESWSN
jgi:hypothetical protein